MCTASDAPAVPATPGEAISLVCVDEHKLLRDIERVVQRRIPQVVVNGYAPDAAIKAEPIFKGRNPGANTPRRASNASDPPRRKPRSQSASGNSTNSGSAGRNSTQARRGPGQGAASTPTRRTGNTRPRRTPG